MGTVYSAWSLTDDVHGKLSHPKTLEISPKCQLTHTMPSEGAQQDSTYGRAPCSRQINAGVMRWGYCWPASSEGRTAELP